MSHVELGLRLPRHLVDQLTRAAEAGSVSVNDMAALAVAEKLGRLEVETFYKIREGRSVPGAGWRALERMGRDTPPAEGDEVLPDEP